jgi:hypothetical protein
MLAPLFFNANHRLSIHFTLVLDLPGKSQSKNALRCRYQQNFALIVKAFSNIKAKILDIF